MVVETQPFKWKPIVSDLFKLRVAWFYNSDSYQLQPIAQINQPRITPDSLQYRNRKTEIVLVFKALARGVTETLAMKLKNFADNELSVWNNANFFDPKLMFNVYSQENDERLFSLSNRRILEWMDLTMLFLYPDKFKEPRNTQKNWKLPAIAMFQTAFTSCLAL